ncbi:MAG: Xaa-Pro aminopeptidase [Paraglaciecola sp.]|jgi:Xaa-Pro aminopeptidase
MFHKDEFHHRRQALLARMQPNSLCLIPGANLQVRSRDTHYPFRQDSYFQYLSGFPEPDAYLVLSNAEAFPNGLSILFCLAKDPQSEIWHGRRCGPKKAKKQYGMDLAFGVDELEDRLPEVMLDHQHLYFAQGEYDYADELLFSCLETMREAPKQSMPPPGSINDVRPLLDDMRLFKSPAELVLMEEAGRISVGAHIKAMGMAKPGCFEYQLAAHIHHEFAMHGAIHPAYGTIVAGGENACILHYTENSQVLRDGDLVLIDAGGEWQGYAADITRTFPVSGTFSVAQKQLYQLVLDAQLAAMEWLKPGNTLKQATECAIKVITEGLINLGLLQGELDSNIRQHSYREFFMHGLSHWLGLDVHDVGDYKVSDRDRPLEIGMVLTVEPGLYIAMNAEVDNCWRGIGIRIEDNVVITAGGYKNLTAGAPKQIWEIEKLMSDNTRMVD